MDADQKNGYRDQRTRIRTCTFHLMRTNCAPHTRPRRGVVNIAPPTVRYSEQILYAAILQRASHRVRYPELGGCLLFGCFYCISYIYVRRLQLVHATVSVIW